MLGIDVPAGCLVPGRELPVVVHHSIGLRPPDLVVGRGEHLAQLGARDRAPDRHMDMGSKPFLRFDDGEVLHVVAEVPAQVLYQPVEQRSEVDRIARRPLVVVAARDRPACRQR